MKVRIDVQGNKRNGFYAEIRTLSNGRLVGLCGHETGDRHPNPGTANNCGESAARAKGWVVYE
jgi:hypothetical protein